jgi:putative pyruvate formate lyase activating enzyme
LNLPLVYNCAGYENLETLKLLDGVVDIYLPDAKYSDNKNALRTSKMPRYVDHNQLTLREMYRQVGPLQLDDEGIARRGLLIRHLVMPEDVSGTREVLHWIADELGPDTPISLMDQYFPAWKAVNDPILNRRLTWHEYSTALNALDEFKFTAGYVQEDLVEIDTTSDV